MVVATREKEGTDTCTIGNNAQKSWGALRSDSVNVKLMIVVPIGN